MVVFDRPRRVLFSTTLRAFVESRPPRAIALATPRDTVANLLRIARRAHASQVLVVDEDEASSETQSTNRASRALTRAVSMRDVATAWMRTSLSDGAFYEQFTTRELCDAIGAPSTQIVWYDESTREYDAQTLLDACTALSRGRKIAVVHDGEFAIVDVVTKYDLVCFLSRRAAHLGEIADMPVASLFPGRRVVSAPASASARGAVRDMLDADVSAIALTTPVGDGAPNEIIACLSLNDFRRIDSHGDFTAMKTRSALDFVSRKRADTFRADDRVPFESRRHATGSHRYVELVFAKSDTSFERLLALYADHEIHHVFVLRADDFAAAPQREFRVLTPSDLIDALAAR